MNAIERLEELAAKASDRPWATGRNSYGLVTQGRCVNGAAGAGDVEYYGGYLIAESCARPDREFICALVNALPDLLEAARAIERLGDIDCERVPEETCLALAIDPGGRCDWCALRAIRERLFAETALAERPPTP